MTLVAHEKVNSRNRRPACTTDTRRDTLNTRSHNSELDQQLTGLNAELQEKDTLVQRYELEARRRTVEVEKKQHELMIHLKLCCP